MFTEPTEYDYKQYGRFFEKMAAFALFSDTFRPENSISTEDITEYSISLENFAKFEYKDHATNPRFYPFKNHILFLQIIVTSNISHKRNEFFIISTKYQGSDRMHSLKGTYTGKNPSLFSKLKEIFLREQNAMNRSMIIRISHDSHIFIPDSENPNKIYHLPDFSELQTS